MFDLDGAVMHVHGGLIYTIEEKSRLRCFNLVSATWLRVRVTGSASEVRNCGKLAASSKT